MELGLLSLPAHVLCDNILPYLPGACRMMFGNSCKTAQKLVLEHYKWKELTVTLDLGTLPGFQKFMRENRHLDLLTCITIKVGASLLAYDHGLVPRVLRSVKGVKLRFESGVGTVKLFDMTFLVSDLSQILPNTEEFEIEFPPRPEIPVEDFHLEEPEYGRSMACVGVTFDDSKLQGQSDNCNWALRKLKVCGWLWGDWLKVVQFVLGSPDLLEELWLGQEKTLENIGNLSYAGTLKKLTGYVYTPALLNHFGKLTEVDLSADVIDTEVLSSSRELLRLVKLNFNKIRISATVQFPNAAIVTLSNVSRVRDPNFVQKVMIAFPNIVELGLFGEHGPMYPAYALSLCDERMAALGALQRLGKISLRDTSVITGVFLLMGEFAALREVEVVGCPNFIIRTVCGRWSSTVLLSIT